MKRKDSMEISNTDEFELTIEDVLNLHRYWITKLYMEERKTASEIVELLHDRHLQATVAHIRSCIRNWNLVLPDIRPESPTFPLPKAPQSPQHSELPAVASTRSRKSSTSNVSYAPSDPDVVVLYTFKPLPPLPDVKHNDSKIRKQKSPTNDRIRLTCHHGPLPSDSHELQTSLDAIPRGLGLTTLEMYMGVEQSHERVAVGLDRELDLSWYKRARDVGDEKRFLKSRRRVKGKRGGLKDEEKVGERDKQGGQRGKGKEKEREGEGDCTDEGMGSS